MDRRDFIRRAGGLLAGMALPAPLAKEEKTVERIFLQGDLVGRIPLTRDIIADNYIDLKYEDLLRMMTKISEWPKTVNPVDNLDARPV